MQVIYRNKKFLERTVKKKHRISLTKISERIKRLYPMLYKEVGSKNVRKILKAVLRNTSRDKAEE